MTSNPTWFDLAVLEAVQFAPGGTVGAVGAVGAVVKLSELSIDRRTVDAQVNGVHGWAAVVNCHRTARIAVGGCRRTVVITVITVGTGLKRRGGQPGQLLATGPLVRARRSKCSRPWPVAPPFDSALRPGRPLSLVGALGSCGEPTR